MFRRSPLIVVLFFASLVSSTAVAQFGGGGMGGARMAPPAKQSFKIFRMVHVKPDDAVDTLTSLFAESIDQNLLKIAIEPRSKSLIAKGEEETLKQLEALLMRLDEGVAADQEPAKPTVIQLKNISGSSTADILRQQRFGAFTVHGDDRTNSLFLTGSETVIQQIKQFVELLDAPIAKQESSEEDISIRMVWLVAKELTKGEGLPVTTDIAPMIESLRRKTGIGELRTAAQLLVHKSHDGGSLFKASGTSTLVADFLNAPFKSDEARVDAAEYSIQFSGSVRQLAANRYTVMVHARSRLLNDKDAPAICEMETECRSIVPGHPVVVGTSTMASYPAVFVIQILDK